MSKILSQVFISIRIIVFLYFISAFIVSVANAQTITPQFRHYTTADGLPSSEVYEVIQDRNGYMWFATDRGANCSTASPVWTSY